MGGGLACGELYIGFDGDVELLLVRVLELLLSGAVLTVAHLLLPLSRAAGGFLCHRMETSKCSSETFTLAGPVDRPGI